MRTNLNGGSGAAALHPAPPGGRPPTPGRRGPGGWLADALCKLFVPEIWDRPDESLKARHLCVRHCPVQVQCQAWARQQRWHECVVGGDRWAPRGDSPAARPTPGGERLARMVRPDCLLCQTPEPWNTPSSRPLPSYPFLSWSPIRRTPGGAL